MITTIESGDLYNPTLNPAGPASATMVGLSTDTKPTGMSVGNGWSFIEMDTKKIYFYDAANTTWREF